MTVVRVVSVSLWVRLQLERGGWGPRFCPQHFTCVSHAPWFHDSNGRQYYEHADGAKTWLPLKTSTLISQRATLWGPRSPGTSQDGQEPWEGASQLFSLELTTRSNTIASANFV